MELLLNISRCLYHKNITLVLSGYGVKGERGKREKDRKKGMKRENERSNRKREK